MAYGTIKADKIQYDASGTDTDVNVSDLMVKAPLASPAFTGTPTAPTAGASVNTTQLATTEYVTTAVAGKADLADPNFTGTINGAALILSGDLTVNGTTSTINSTTLTVDDKNIELGSVASPTDSTADGGGITLKGDSDKTILWTDATDSWDFNQDIKTSGTVTDSGGNVRSIPQNSQTAAYTLVATDAGKHIFTTTGTVTVPNSVFSAGDAVTIVNHSGSAIAINKGTNMYYSADATNANRTLAGRGMATLLFTAADTCYISGAGLS